MKNRLFLSGLICALCIGIFANTVDVQKIHNSLKKVEEYLLQEEGSPKQPSIGFLHLMDAIILTAKKADMDEKTLEKLSQARNLFKEKSILHHEGVEIIHKVYKNMNDGSDYIFPKEIASINDAVAYARQQVTQTKEQINSRDFSDSTKSLLEVAIMVVTPMEKKLLVRLNFFSFEDMVKTAIETF